MKCVNCKSILLHPYKTFRDNDPTRRISASKFYKGRRTTKYWCKPCWEENVTKNEVYTQRAEEARKQLATEIRAERKGKEDAS